MSYMKLIKLLYLLDREALVRWGRPVTGDTYVSMKHGPVLSQVLNLITEGAGPGEENVWSQYVSAAEGYDVRLQADNFSTDELSRAEERIIAEIFEKYGHMNRWKLVELLHQVLPEWTDPRGSASPINYRDILKASGKEETEVAAIEAELDARAIADFLIPAR
jgi:uncharacterized phage-associated protein